MKYLKMLGLAAVAAMALTAFTAGSASATTLEVGGVTKNASVAITASLESGTSAKLALTSGAFANTCTVSHVSGSSASPFTGTTVSGPISSLSFSTCTSEKVVVHKPGSLTIAHTGTTNGTVTSKSAEVTVPSPIGTLTCTTPAAGTDIGTLTGVAAGSATMDIKAVLNCGFLAPSAVWEGAYSVTSPSGLGVSA